MTKNVKPLVAVFLRTGGLAALVLALGVGFGSVADAAPLAKVEICHHETKHLDFPSSNWHVIEVNENAIQAHLNHGDALIFGANDDGSCLPD